MPLERILAAFKLWLGFDGVNVRRATVDGFIDKIAIVWFFRECAVLLSERGMLWRFSQPVHYGPLSCQRNGAPRWTEKKLATAAER